MKLVVIVVVAVVLVLGSHGAATVRMVPMVPSCVVLAFLSRAPSGILRIRANTCALMCINGQYVPTSRFGHFVHLVAKVGLIWIYGGSPN
jgi:hypothetical protein